MNRAQGPMNEAETADFIRRANEAYSSTNGTGRRPDDHGPIRDAEPWTPFPLEAMPEPLRSYAHAGAAAIGCDVSYLALPLLSVFAAAVGNARRISLKRNWSEPCILWTCTVGESGSQKSPALDLARDLPRRRQALAFKRHGSAMDDWEQLPEDERGKEPTCQRCVVDDTTIEALAPVLMENPRGVLLSRDELAGWLGAFDRYTKSRGGEAARWIEVFGGRPVTIDRKTNRQTIYIPRASVSIMGGIQPGILRQLITREHRDSGLLARLLLARPPRRAKRWTEADVDTFVTVTVERAYEKLHLLAPDTDDDGEPTPHLIRLAPDAKRKFISFVNEHGKEQVDLDGDLSACWSKLEGYSARLAMVCHLTRWAHDEDVEPDDVDAASIEAGIVLSRWFGREAKRLYAELDATDADREQQELVDLIRRRGGVITARDLAHASRRHREAGAAEAALEALAKAGLGRWEEVIPAGGRGRPSRALRLV